MIKDLYKMYLTNILNDLLIYRIFRTLIKLLF